MCVSVLGACLVAAQLTALDVNHHDLPSVAKSYDGKERSVARFYDNDRMEYRVGADFYFDTNTRVGLLYDNGVDASKYQKDRELTVSVTQYININRDKYGTGWSTTVSGMYEFGGDVSHKACTDSFNREYYCGNLTAWSDFKQPDNKNDYAARITMKYSF